RRRLASQYLACAREIGTIEKLHQSDGVSVRTAAAAVEDLLFCVDREAIVSAATRAWTAALGVAAVKLDATTQTFVLDANGTRFFNPRIPRLRSHAQAPGNSGRDSSMSARRVARFRNANATTVAGQLCASAAPI